MSHPDAADTVNLDVQCPKCRKVIQKPLSWLTAKNNMPCDGCGSVIDLQSGYNGLRIQKLASECASIDAAMAKLGDKA